MISIPEMLAELVRRPSVNPMGRTDLPIDLLYESRVTDYLAQCLQHLGVPFERVPVAPGRDNLVARYTPPTPAPFTLLLEAHQDTVPVDGMTVPPFEARVEEGRLYGRGSCDVKAGVAAMFAAFARLISEKPAGSANVILAFTVDEEHTFLGAQHLVKSGIRADFAVVAEPTLLNIVRTHKGVVRWQLETPGIACHSSRPDRGVSAVYRMARIVQALETYAELLQTSRTDPLLGPPTLSVGMIQGGVSPNTVPDFCRIDIDRRLLPGEYPEAVIEDVQSFLRSRPEIDFPWKVHRKLACPPLPPTGGDEFVGQLGAAIDSVVGGHEITAVPFGTDASTIREAGIPAVVFGPGDIAQAHTKDEWIELKQVEQAAEILFRFVACR
jgi:acetylornithine deacetylase